MTALWYVAAKSPPRTRILFWTGLVVLFVLSSFLPPIPGIPIRLTLALIPFAVLGMAIERGQGRVFRVIMWTVLSGVLLLAGLTALLD